MFYKHRIKIHIILAIVLITLLTLFKVRQGNSIDNTENSEPTEAMEIKQPRKVFDPASYTLDYASELLSNSMKENFELSGKFITPDGEYPFLIAEKDDSYLITRTINNNTVTVSNINNKLYYDSKNETFSCDVSDNTLHLLDQTFKTMQMHGNFNISYVEFIGKRVIKYRDKKELCDMIYLQKGSEVEEIETFTKEDDGNYTYQTDTLYGNTEEKNEKFSYAVIYIEPKTQSVRRIDNYEEEKRISECHIDICNELVAPKNAKNIAETEFLDKAKLQ